MEDLKVERSALKKKVTVLSKQMKKAIQRRTDIDDLKVINTEMKAVFLEFIKVDEEYGTTLEEDPTLQEKYSVINDLDTEQYTESVISIYEEAKKMYEQCKKEEDEKLARRKIMTGVKMMRSKLGVIAKIKDSEDIGKLLELKKKVDDLIEEAQEMMLAVDELPDVD